MQRETGKYAARITGVIISNIQAFALTIKESPPIQIITILTLLSSISELNYIYGPSTPKEYRSEVFGFVSILIGLVGLLYALYSTVISGKQLKQASNEIGKMQIDYWNTRGIDQIRKKEFYDAGQSYQMAININSNDVRIWINIAGSLFRQKMYDDALQAINKAIEIDPQLCSPECLNFIYSRLQITFSFNHLIQSPSYSGTFPICILPAALTRMHYLAFADTISYRGPHEI